MDVLLESLSSSLSASAGLCFNPCFNGCASGITYRDIIGTIMHVSILVLMDVLLEYLCSCCPLFGYRVSILVLMDVLLESAAISIFTIMRSGFNPCFNGCASGIRWQQR